MKAYKFLKDDLRSGSGDEPPWSIGKKRTIKGKLALCQRGYHSSPSFYDALGYAAGNVACIVEITEPTERQNDKYVSHSCTIVSAVSAEKILRTWGCDCAERALKQAKITNEQSWNAIKIARLYNEGKATKEELSAAGSAAESAAWSAARSAAGSAEWSAAGSAAESAAWSAAESVARSAETEWQKLHLEELINAELKREETK